MNRLQFDYDELREDGRFLWGMSVALETGLPYNQSLDLAKQIVSPSELTKRLLYVVPQGRPLSYILRQSGYFEPVILQMIETGEEAGTLPSTLQQVAIYIENKFI